MLNVFVQNGNAADDFVNNKTIVTLDIINDMQDKVFHGIKSYELESLKNYLSDGWMCFYSSSHYFNGFKKKNKYFVSYIYDNKFDNAIIECENNMPFNECMTFDKRIKYIENELQASKNYQYNSNKRGMTSLFLYPFDIYIYTHIFM